MKDLIFKPLGLLDSPFPKAFALTTSDDAIQLWQNGSDLFVYHLLKQFFMIFISDYIDTNQISVVITSCSRKQVIEYFYRSAATVIGIILRCPLDLMMRHKRLGCTSLRGSIKSIGWLGPGRQ